MTLVSPRCFQPEIPSMEAWGCRLGLQCRRSSQLEYSLTTHTGEESLTHSQSPCLINLCIRTQGCATYGFDVSSDYNWKANFVQAAASLKGCK